MREAFTLVELLVVLAIMTVIMGVVVPQGAKMLGSYQHHIERLRQEANLSHLQARSFLELHEFNVTVGEKYFHTTIQGAVRETRNDHH